MVVELKIPGTDAQEGQNPQNADSSPQKRSNARHNTTHATYTCTRKRKEKTEQLLGHQPHFACERGI